MARNIFSQIKGNKPGYNTFDLSHEKKLSLNMGTLVPILVQEIVPGDKFQVNNEIFMRLAPMVAPMMHRVNVFTHSFFVPNRLVWDDWESFITGGPDGLETPIFPKHLMTTPEIDLYKKGTLADYMGLPTPDDTSITNGLEFSMLPFRAYQLIWNEFFRDQNLTDPIEIDKDSNTTNATEMLSMRLRAWEKDYFTSCLPWAQRGQEISIPTSAQFSPDYLSIAETVHNAGTPPADSNISSVDGDLTYDGQGTGTIKNLADPQYVEGTSVTINELRKAIKLQEWLERNARGGARYIEQILSHFGVISSDSRLQRPEYLGGGKAPIVISETLQTSATVVDGGDPHANLPPSPQGNMAGHGIATGNSNRFRKRFEEHGYIITVMSVLPRTAYVQGLHKHFSRFDKFDHYFPEFAHLGEQEVLNQEIYVGSDDDPTILKGTFGYQSRFAEMKFQQSSVHGDFKDNLNYWHMAREFNGTPALNTAFVTSDPTQRIFNVTDPDEHKLYCQVYNNVKAIRPMPYYGTPAI